MPKDTGKNHLKKPSDGENFSPTAAYAARRQAWDVKLQSSAKPVLLRRQSRSPLKNVWDGFTKGVPSHVLATGRPSAAGSVHRPQGPMLCKPKSEKPAVQSTAKPKKPVAKGGDALDRLMGIRR
jgi:hypothetical protein